MAEKNMNKVRHIPYGRKTLYFEDINDAARFINLYRDLFVKGVQGSTYASTDKYRYKLIFWMNHDDWYKVKEDLNIKVKKLIFKYDFLTKVVEKRCNCYVK